MNAAAPAWADLPAAWSRARETVRARVGEANFAAWIAPLHCRRRDEEVLLEAPDRIVRERVARHFLHSIEEALVHELRSTCTLRVDIRTAPAELPIRVSPPAAIHTFETLITGKSNTDAHTAARALCAGTGRSPLLIHGPSGVGKTHLLHAVHHALDDQGLVVACLSAAELVTALVTAYEQRGLGAFWTDLAPLRALLLDDVHSLAGQPQIQERLLDGLVDWAGGHRLLVLTSDRPLEALPELAARLAARSARGLAVSIAPPEPTLRLAILQAKARAQGLDLDVRLATRIAAGIGGSIRRLEGALTRLLAHARLQGRRIDEALAVEILPELRARAAATPLVVERIVDATASAFGTSARRLYGRSRQDDLRLARQIAMYLARKLLQQPFAQLAAAFDRDHAAVAYACRAVAARLGTDDLLSERVARIERQLVDEEG